MLPFDTAASGGSILLVDPDSPAATPVVADSAFGLADPQSGFISAQIVATYDFNASTGAASNRQPASVVYVKNGSLFKVSLAGGASRTPQQFSGLTDVCLLSRQYGDGSLADAYVQVQETGTSGCNGTQRLVKVSASTSDMGTALRADQTVKGQVTNASGKIAGFLVTETDSGTLELRRYDLALSTATDLLSLTTGSQVFSASQPFIPGSGALVYFTAQADSASARSLYRFNPDGSSVSKIQDLSGAAGIGSTNGFGQSDGTDYYYVDGGNIDKVAHTSTTASTLLSRTLGTGESLQVAALTSTRVVFSDGGGAQTSLETLPKAGGNSTVIDSAATSATSPVTFVPVFVNGERLFYTHTATTVGTSGVSFARSAHQAMSDGSGAATTASDGYWAGVTLNESGFSHVILGTLNSSNKDVHLLGYSPTSGTETADLGVVPNVNAFSEVFVIGTYGDKVLFSVIPDGASDQDVYFVDAGTAGSVRAIAATVSVNEGAIQ